MAGAHSQTPAEPTQHRESEAGQQSEPTRRAAHRAEEGYDEVTTGRRRILVTGSRDWWNEATIVATILRVWTEWGRPPITLVHGGAKGADLMAAGIINTAPVDKPGYFKTEAHPALWDIHGRAAGHIRNAEMVALGADIVIGFIRNESRGATGCVKLAEAAGIPLLVFREDGVIPPLS
jgi:hypothetical protein